MKKRIPYLRLKVAIGIIGSLAMMLGIGVGLYYAFIKKDVVSFVVEEQLLASVQQTNAGCPMMLDEDTRLDGVMYIKGPELEYRYTMVNMLAEGYDAPSVQQTVEASIIENIKKDESLAFARANGVTFTYLFNDKRGDFLLKVKVTPDKYK